MDSARTSRGWLIRHIRASCSLSSMRAAHVRSFPFNRALLCATNLQLLLLGLFAAEVFRLLTDISSNDLLE